MDLTVEQRAARREHEMRWRDIGMLLSEVHRREHAFIDAAHGGTHPDRVGRARCDGCGFYRSEP